jgi:hypothetical protein
MAVEGDSLLEPRLKLRILRSYLVRHDAEGCAAVDRFEAVEDGAQKGFIACRISHVVDREDDDRLDPRFTHPLRRYQSGEAKTGFVGIHNQRYRAVRRCGVFAVSIGWTDE